MADVYDFSFAHASIGPAELGDAGAVGWIGYVASDRRKSITRDEVHRLWDAGLPGALVHEETVDFRSWNGDLANRLADAIGWPADRPIYYAVDRNEPTSAYREISSRLGLQPGRPKGIYGGKGLIHRCLDDGTAVVGWATNATSFDNGDHDQRGIALQQLFGQSSIPQTDRNLVFLDDWGQAPIAQQPQPPQEEPVRIGVMVTPIDPNHPHFTEVVYVAEGSSVAVHVPDPHMIDVYRFIGVGGPVPIESEWFDALAIIQPGHLKIPT